MIEKIVKILTFVRCTQLKTIKIVYNYRKYELLKSKLMVGMKPDGTIVSIVIF